MKQAMWSKVLPVLALAFASCAGVDDVTSAEGNARGGLTTVTSDFESGSIGAVQRMTETDQPEQEVLKDARDDYVEGAANERAAEKIARAIANSPLVKTAIAGSDPNWGRILCAAGYAGVAFDPRKVDIDMQGIPVCRGGLAADFFEDALKTKLDERDCHIRFAIRGSGRGRARFWTCDFTYDYIRINASYRT